MITVACSVITSHHVNAALAIAAVVAGAYVARGGGRRG